MDRRRGVASLGFKRDTVTQGVGAGLPIGTDADSVPEHSVCRRLERSLALMRRASTPKKHRGCWLAHVCAESLAKQALSHLSYGPFTPDSTGLCGVLPCVLSAVSLALAV
jgi:hypothetical protein